MSYSLIDKQRAPRNGRYTPDLDDMLSQCELNYWLIKRLIPELADLEPENNENVLQKPEWQLESKSVHLTFQVTDIARYTTTLNLTFETPLVELMRSGKLILRLYHDVQMLEVMEGSGPAALQAIYEQSEGGKKTVDEKRQINRFIGECLRACFDKMQMSEKRSAS